MLKAIVFDFDGVVVDSEPMHFRAFEEVARTIGFFFDWDRYLREFIGYDDRDAFRAMLRKLNKLADDQQIAQLCQQKQDVIDRMIGEGVPMVPGSRALIEQVYADTDLAIAIASGATTRDIEQMLTGLGLRDRFQVIVSADNVAQSKPHPQTYELAAQQIGVEPQHCLAIEDTAFGLQSARAAGMMTLGLTTTSEAAALHEASRVKPNLDAVTTQMLRQWYGGANHTTGK